MACNCFAGKSEQCKHIYALIHYINSDLSSSKTSEEQGWGKPSAKQLGSLIYSKGKEIAEMWRPKKDQNNVNIPVYSLKVDDVDFRSPLRSMLMEESRKESEMACLSILQNCLTEAVTRAERERCVACVLNLVVMAQDNCIRCEEEMRFVSVESEDFYKANVYVNETEIIDLCIRTREQSDSSEWIQARNLRITASSNVHAIKVFKGKNFSALAKNLVNPKTFSGPSVEYGKRKESLALRAYKKSKNVDVIPLGLLVSVSQPWLGASVDGVVIEDFCVTKLVEIKCPSSCKYKHVVDFDTGTSNVGYLKFIDGILQLHDSHMYYTQCQMQMYITGLTVCDFFVWSKFSHVTVEVHRNDEFLSPLIPRLQKFYFGYYIEELRSKYVEQEE